MPSDLGSVLAQRTEPFCSDAFINEPGHRNIKHASARSHPCEISPLHAHRQEYFIPEVKALSPFFSWERRMLWFDYVWTDSVLSCQKWVCKMEQIPKPNRRKHAVPSWLYLHKLSVNLRRDCMMWFYNSPWTKARDWHWHTVPPCSRPDLTSHLYLSNVSDSLGAITPRDRLGLKIDTAQCRTLVVNDISISEE